MILERSKSNLSFAGLHEAGPGGGRQGPQPGQVPGQPLRQQGGALRQAEEARLPAGTGQERYMSL